MFPVRAANRAILPVLWRDPGTRRLPGGARDFATTFSPHALVRTAHRLHFDGYLLFQDDVGRGHYWDMVASRGKASSRAESVWSVPRRNQHCLG